MLKQSIEYMHQISIKNGYRQNVLHYPQKLLTKTFMDKIFELRSIQQDRIL